ncbi:unnamed protein product [Allacma fusca]|uniref:Uncharacterized protein n=1 Tax=Allacma fusca TaxID=39272 RepID=A0A8J2KXS8_9HEXA|nr:unnamed protein product [Allacma fusca]
MINSENLEDFLSDVDSDVLKKPDTPEEEPHYFYSNSANHQTSQRTETIEKLPVFQMPVEYQKHFDYISHIRGTHNKKAILLMDCKHCNATSQSLKYNSSVRGAPFFNFRRHLEQQQFINDFIDCIAIDMLPLDFIERPTFIKLVRNLDGNIRLVSTRTLVRRITESYTKVGFVVGDNASNVKVAFDKCHFEHKIHSYDQVEVEFSDADDDADSDWEDFDDFFNEKDNTCSESDTELDRCQQELQTWLNQPLMKLTCFCHLI